jgi:beta propeller repeat protein
MHTMRKRIGAMMATVFAGALFGCAPAGCGCSGEEGSAADGDADAAVEVDADRDVDAENDAAPGADADIDSAVDAGPNPNVIVFPEEGYYDVSGFTNRDLIVIYAVTENPTTMYYYDIANLQEHRIDTPHAQYCEDVFGSEIIYTDFALAETETDPQTELYLYDMATETHTRLTDTPWNESYARLNQDYLLFKSSEGCSGPYDTKLVLMNRHTEEQTVLADCDRNPETTSLSEHYAAWVAYHYGGEGKDVFYHDLQTGITHHIESTGPGSQFFPTTDEDHVVWQDSRSGHREVYMYTISTGVEECLTPDEWEQAWPHLRDGLVLWADYSTTQEWGEEGASQVYVYEIETGAGRQLTNKAQMWMPRFVDSGWAVYAWSIIGHKSKIYAHDLVGDGILTTDGHVIP